MRTQNRNGLTLIDVAVVLIILVVLAAFLLPATRGSREAALRSNCKNKLRQLGLAMHNYHETHLVFPPGWVAVRGPLSGEQERSAYGWGTYIIPFIDSAPLYRSINFKAADPSFQVQGQGSRGEFAQKLLPCYRCPSDLGESQDRTSSVALMGTTNYVGNFGVGIPLFEHESQMMQGAFGCNSSIRIRDIRDGTTNFVLAGERMLLPSGTAWAEHRVEGPFNSYWAGIPRGVNPLAIVGTITDGDITEVTNPEAALHDGLLNSRGPLNGYHSDPKRLRYIGINRTSDGKPMSSSELAGKSVSSGFSSYHSGGAQVLLGDGTVRFISNSISPVTLIDLMRRADGQTLGEF